MTDVEFFQGRRDRSAHRLEEFEVSLRRVLEEDLDRVLGDHTCVFATGSGGRLEMGEASDLDVFLVRVNGDKSRIDEVLLQAAVIRAMAACGLPAPSRDALFLSLHTAAEFEEHLGSPEDDELNKLTPRMLLLLESRPVLDPTVYRALVDRVLGLYWKDEVGHEESFLPIFLVNDIVRYWRIILLNHESNLRSAATKRRTREKPTAEFEAYMRRERRRSAYKLRFPRALTCFASLAYLLALAKVGGAPIGREKVLEMVDLTPLERLGRVASMLNDPGVGELRKMYRQYLERMDRPRERVDRDFADDDSARGLRSEAERFVRGVFDLIMALQDGNPLFRYVVV